MIEIQTSEGLVLAVCQDLHHVLLGLWLKAKGARKVKIEVAGVWADFSPFQAANVFLSMDSDLRLLVKGGIARVFPRPSGNVCAEHITINGKRVDEHQLALWKAVWPSMEHLCSRRGFFFCDEPIERGCCGHSK